MCCVFLQYNRTALHLAAEKGHYNIVTFLYGQGAAVDKVDDVSSTCVRVHDVIDSHSN